MLRSEIPYSVCTDADCDDRRCIPCSLTPPIESCCRATVRCPSTGEWHPCASKRVA